MKEFFNLLGWKELIAIFLTLIIIRISIIIPFYAQWNLPPTITWESFLMFAFGLCFLMAGNNVLVKFCDEKQKVLRQETTNKLGFEIKKFPDLVRLRGVWVVLWAVGIIACGSSFVMTKYNYFYIITGLLFVAIGYLYATSLRHKFLSGNIALSFMYALVVLSQIPHDWDFVVPYSYEFPNPMAISWVDILYVFIFIAVLVFMLTMIKDITGDITNMEDDRKMNYHTFAVRLGEKNSKIALQVMSIVFIVLVALFLCIHSDKMEFIHTLTLAVIVIGPMIYYMVMLAKAKKQTDYNDLHVFLGMIMISLIFLMFYCKYLFIFDFSGSIK